MSNLISQEILNITAYIPGKPIEEVKRELELKSVVKLASNENPYGMSTRVVSVIKNNLSSINRYPDGSCFYLKKELAKFLKINENCLCFGNGSDEILDVIIKTFVGQNEEIITSDVTFLEYKICSLVNQKNISTVELKDFKYDLEAILDKINAKTKLIFIANPNNPTGTYVTKKELENFLNKIPKNIVVVLDEAYFEFVTEKDYYSPIRCIKDKNVVILRTFSKAYGLAGLRIGFAIAREGFIDVFNRVRQPFNINSLAQVAAIAALGDQKFVKKVVASNAKEKRLLYTQLERLNLTFIPSVTNFILVKVAGSGKELCNKLLKKGVIIRDMDQYGLKNFVRITIGTPNENKLLIKELRG